MTFFASAFHLHPKNIVWNKPVTIYTTTPTHNSHVIIHFNLQQTFHTRLIWSKNRLYQVVSFFLVESEKFNSNLNSKFIWLCTHCTCYITTKGIKYFYCSLVILKILLNILFYDQTFQSLPATVSNFSTRLHKLPLIYFYMICKYYQTRKDWRVLGHPQRNIPLI